MTIHNLKEYLQYLKKLGVGINDRINSAEIYLWKTKVHNFQCEYVENDYNYPLFSWSKHYDVFDYAPEIKPLQHPYSFMLVPHHNNLETLNKNY